MEFWVYENWRAYNKAVIHTGICGNCNHGRGCHTNPLGNANGQWHGPFPDLPAAISCAQQTGRDLIHHSCLRNYA